MNRGVARSDQRAEGPPGCPFRSGGDLLQSLRAIHQGTTNASGPSPLTGSLGHMDWLASLGGFWLSLLAWLAGLAVAFGILARLTPCNPGMYWWKDLRAAGADFMYWFIVPVFLNIGRTVMLIA